MNDTEIRDYIIHHLADAVEPDDIIFDICQKTCRSWPEAEALVKQVQAESKQVVAKRQFPLLTVIAFGIFIGGVALLISAIFSLILTFDAFAISNPNTLNAIGAFLYLLNYAPGFLVLAGFGFAMILGSLLGMRSIWASVLFKDEA